MSKIETLKKEIESLKEQLSKFKEVAYARINDRGDLYDLRLQKNPFLDPNTIVLLYQKLN